MKKKLLSLLLVLPHVLSAKNDGTADQQGADRREEHVDGGVQADRAHGVDAHVIGGKKTGHDAVDRTHRRQDDLDRQKAEHQLCDHSGIGGKFFHTASPMHVRGAGTGDPPTPSKQVSLIIYHR